MAALSCARLRKTMQLIAPLQTTHPDPEFFGGKGASLARLSSAGFQVPAGFVVTTDTYFAFVKAHQLDDWLDKFACTQTPDLIEGAVRQRFGAAGIPESVAQSIREAYAEMGRPPVAVRSSANAEDLPDLSFAGQYESFLNVSGEEEVIQRVVACWASLWTTRAVAYRRTHELSHDNVAMAVVVQEMVQSELAGVLFTANPQNGRRTEMVLEAAPGLGDALVSGRVEPERYLLDGKTGEVREHQAGAGGVLASAAIAELARLGRDVATFFGAPQDIEWSFAVGRIHLVQSRPVTSLYPLPEGLSPDGPLHVLGSVGAIQGMLEPFTPLGRETLCSVFAGGARLFGFDVDRDNQRILFTAGERLFANATPILRHPIGRRVLSSALPMMEPGVASAFESVVGDSRLIRNRRFSGLRVLVRAPRFLAPYATRLLLALARPHRRRISVTRRVNAILDDYGYRFRATRTLPERLALSTEALSRTVPTLIRTYIPLFAAGMASFVFLRWLCGEEALKFARGLPNNVTTEMDLELWDTAVAIRAHGPNRQLEGFLNRFGMRGVGEIDLGRPRWREDPSSLERAIESYLRIEDPDRSPRAVFERGAREAEAAIDRMAAGWKGPLVRFAAQRLRALGGLRESPKFFLVNVLGHVREAMLASARELVEAGRLDTPEDLFFLKYSELCADADWRETVRVRRFAYEHERHRRQIPRVLTSEGEAFYESGPVGTDDGNFLVGTPVSPGVAEGRMHVVRRPEGATFEPGDILVCPGTDPAWTPLFLVAGAFVTEVGGLMTHGSVVAREYGIPAVVGVHEATTRLSSGQRVRVDGTSGLVALLDP